MKINYSIESRECDEDQLYILSMLDNVMKISYIIEYRECYNIQFSQFSSVEISYTIQSIEYDEGQYAIVS